MKMPPAAASGAVSSVTVRRNGIRFKYTFNYTFGYTMRCAWISVLDPPGMKRLSMLLAGLSFAVATLAGTYAAAAAMATTMAATFIPQEMAWRPRVAESVGAATRANSDESINARKGTP